MTNYFTSKKMEIGKRLYLSFMWDDESSFARSQLFATSFFGVTTVRCIKLLSLFLLPFFFDTNLTLEIVSRLVSSLVF